MGPFGPCWGAALSGTPWPIFGEVVPLMMLMTVRVGFPPNIPYKPPIGGQFGAFHVEMKHLPNAPLLSTYKRLPPHQTRTHQGKEHHT